MLTENTLGRRQDEDQWVCHYAATYGFRPIFRVIMNTPVVSRSTDHVSPRGAFQDNTVHRPFNRALHSAMPGNGRLRVLDLGCAGGGFVRSLLKDGDVAIGIEGSGVPKNKGLGEWATCPLHLFTADICEPFEVGTVSGSKIQFDAVTAWEILEHIPESSVPILARNIAHHLRLGGLCVASVDSTPDINPLTGAVYHVTLRPKECWLNAFRSFGLEEDTAHGFRTDEFVRGNAIGLKNWDPAAGDGFHLVLRKKTLKEGSR